jgi:hypothetical protein
MLAVFSQIQVNSLFAAQSVKIFSVTNRADTEINEHRCPAPIGTVPITLTVHL